MLPNPSGIQQVSDGMQQERSEMQVQTTVILVNPQLSHQSDPAMGSKHLKLKLTCIQGFAMRYELKIPRSEAICRWVELVAVPSPTAGGFSFADADLYPV